MAHKRIRERLRRSALYTFACLGTRTRDDDQPHALHGAGYTRTVQCNQPHLHENKPPYYCKNHISTTKYNAITFLPTALFEQFRRVANIYFLLAALLSVFPISPFSPISMIAPLAFVVGLSMVKEALEDSRRFLQDRKVNNRNVSHHAGNGVFEPKAWKDIRVGDVVKVEKDEFFPADLLFLSSSYEDGICYVETMNLDGETNLKVKRSLEAALGLDSDETFKDFTGTIQGEDPNPSLYTFVGNFDYERQVYPLDPSQILLRDSKLRNTDHIYGVVIFTGHDTKVMQNSTHSPSKRSTIEKKMDLIIYILFAVLVIISVMSSVGFMVKTKYKAKNSPKLTASRAFNKSDPLESLFCNKIHELKLDYK
ncbi:putative phospholipid-transporting ATPase 7 [Stylosanthes scabra]|uniref:Phospholipid-transporting ATPase 7 n=1 Tax=Stylosanthes scabra TaxID=79078 RepID=A0ABU6Z155_9FABA|nr:putative phospholipid-transporting ATPase 7 [Stylosanthes scabra]